MSATDRLARRLALGLTLLCAGLGACQSDVYPISARRPVNRACFDPGRPAPRGRVVLTRAFEEIFPDGSELPQAVHLARAPDDPDRWYVALQGGQIMTFVDRPGAQRPEVVLDIASRLYTDHVESGLLSFTFHPDFARNGFLYVAYSALKPRRDPGDGVYYTRLSRFTADLTGGDGPPRFARASERVIVQIDDLRGSHDIDHAVFGPDGYLYISVGDGRNRASARPNGQDLRVLNGKLLRIDVDAIDAVRHTPYVVPADNPFAQMSQDLPDGPRREIYAWGFRNPWRFSFDRETGDLWLGDVGEASREEINRVVKGGNYGWAVREGTLCFDPELCDDPTRGPFVDPVAELVQPRIGAAVAGGFVYRGSAIAELRGRYVFAEYINGNLYSFDPARPDPEVSLEVEAGPGIVSFAESADGELYAVGYSEEGSGIFRVERPVNRTDRFPRRLSLTGCVDPQDPRRPAEGLIPYTPVTSLWSDGSDKERYLTLPAAGRIEVKPDGDFAFPVGTVLMKHFLFDERFHETRLLVHHDDGWAGYSYAWDDDQRDATLLDNALDRTLEKGRRWHYPSRAECLACHTEAAGHVLGLEVAQLAGPTLDGLYELDLFVPGIDGPEELPGQGGAPLVDPAGEAPLERRARSYLHANCSQCHRPGGETQVSIDFRYSTPFREMQLCNVRPDDTLENDDPELRRLRPGRPESSLMALRMGALDQSRMPPLGTQVVDEAAVALITAWIERLDECPERDERDDDEGEAREERGEHER